MTKQRVRVYITIDTECAEERGSAPPMGWDVRVWGRFTNQRRALGLDLINEELGRHAIPATYFVEALGARYFGQDELTKVCNTILTAGHDVQLHAHPRQLRPNHRSLGIPAASDDFADYAVEDQVELLEMGLASLVSSDVPPKTLLGFRAGNYGANNATWQAMAKAGLLVSSNYNPCYFHRNCRMRSSNASAGLFLAEHGTWELPITTFVERGGGHRHAQITAVSHRELRRLLEDAYDCGVGEVTVVTHSFEFCHIDSIDPPVGRPNTLNILRLRALCGYLARNRDRFAVDTIGGLAERIRSGTETPARPPRSAEFRGRRHENGLGC